MSFAVRSITRRGIGVLLLATVLAAAASVALLMSRNAHVIQDKEVEVLAAHARGLALGLRRNGGAGEEWRLVLPKALASRFDPHAGRSFYAVRDASGRAVLSSMDPLPGEVPMVLPNSDAEEPATFRVRRGGMVLRGVTVPVEVDGVPLYIQVADNVGHPDVLTDDLSAGFLGEVSWVILPVFAALALVSFTTLRLCLRPIDALSRRAAQLTGARPGERLEEGEAPVEIRPLVRAMNAALDRADAATAAQRRFTAEAAHQMRTPLAVLKTHAELLADERTGDLLDGDVEALERIVEQLLALAEVDAAEMAPAGQYVDLGALAQGSVEFLDALAARRGVDLLLQKPLGPLMVNGHEEPLYQAILNLLHNAIDHSPPGAAVRISVTAPATVEVADEGPGVPVAQRKLVFRRFWRSRGDRAGQHRGAGLGLAIVQRVAELHKGAVAVTDAPGGGALFRLVLSPYSVARAQRSNRAP